MPGFSAREMLSQLPLRMANGGDVLASSLLRMAHGGPVGVPVEELLGRSAAYRRAEQNTNYSSSADAVQAGHTSAAPADLMPAPPDTA